MKLFVSRTSYKMLAVKSVVFMIPWTISFMVVNHFWPDLIEVDKIVTNLFSNTVVFLIGYILTMIGFRYSSKDEKKVSDDEDGEHSDSDAGSARVVPGTQPKRPFD